MPVSSPFDQASVHRVRAAYASWRGQPGWVHRLVGAVLFLILLGIAAFLFVWGVMVAAVIIAISAIVVGVRAIARHFTGDNSMRRNVRIVRRP